MIQTGSSIRAVLCEQFGLSDEYVQDRIKTIFLDGKAVDDIDNAIVKAGSVLALSGPMPGLAGATLRRGGLLASFRAQITHAGDKTSDTSKGEGMITVKLFNLLLPDLGPVFLKKGIYIKRKDFEGFLRSLPEKFWPGCKSARVGDREINLDDLRRMNWLDPHEFLLLTVNFDLPASNRLG